MEESDKLKKAFDILKNNDIEKSLNHKYFKREGTPGNYKYYYTEADYKANKSVSQEEVLKRRLNEASTYDMSVHSGANTDNGWKISIQGKSVSDSIFLYEKLSQYLIDSNIPFKVATARRYALRDSNKEQSFKAMTIYCPNGVDIKTLCEEVYSLTTDYKGWQNIKTPNSYQHYAGGLFFRNDRDEAGEYIPAK